MTAQMMMRQYQRQAVATSSPELLIGKLYDLAILSCRRQDRPKVRAVLIELIAALNLEAGGELARRLRSIYEFCLTESAAGDLETVQDLLTGLRDAWYEGVLQRRAA